MRTAWWKSGMVLGLILCQLLGGPVPGRAQAGPGPVVYASPEMEAKLAALNDAIRKYNMDHASMLTSVNPDVIQMLIDNQYLSGKPEDYAGFKSEGDLTGDGKIIPPPEPPPVASEPAPVPASEPVPVPPDPPPASAPAPAGDLKDPKLSGQESPQETIDVIHQRPGQKIFLPNTLRRIIRQDLKNPSTPSNQ